ncbi:MAG: 50S ribosomal protein L13 [Pedobacter sp.]|nr:MAG: 50S ribosomal protein L13 [Pedobacter sp.]
MTTDFFLFTETVYPKIEAHQPKVFMIDATGKTLGRLASMASQFLRGKTTSFYTPGVDQGNFVIITNAKKIQVSGKKARSKLYTRNSQRPGSLKHEQFKDLQNRLPTRALEEAIWGMLPKGILGRNYYRRLFVYSDDQIYLHQKVPRKNQKKSHEMKNQIVQLSEFQKNYSFPWVYLT